MDDDTPVELLEMLSKRMDERASRVLFLRSYTNGNAPLPEMGKNVRASWELFQKKARTNYGGRAVQSLNGRLRVNGIRIGNVQTSPALKSARRIWRDNRMDMQIKGAIGDYLTTRYGYLVVGLSDIGEAVVTREMPEMFITCCDPARPWKVTSALKAWRDMDDDTDYAMVWATGVRQKFERPSKTSFGMLRIGVACEDWVPSGPPEMYDGPPTIIAWEREESLIEPHLDVIDRINHGKLNRLVTTAMQAFRQRATKGDLAQKDEDGNDIDWAKIFEPAPGALWDLPEGIDIWESQQTDIRPMLDGEKSDLQDFAASTGTPIAEFIPDGQNQSATGAANVTTPQYLTAKDEHDALGPGLQVMLVYALRAEGVDLGEDTVEILWVEPDRVSMSEKYAAAVQAKGAGLSRRAVMRDILGMSPDQIAQEELDLADEQLSTFALTGGMPPAPSGVPPTTAPAVAPPASPVLPGAPVKVPVVVR